MSERNEPANETLRDDDDERQPDQPSAGLTTAQIASAEPAAQPAGRAAEPQSSRAPTGESRAPLFAEREAVAFRERWQEVQAEFVDDPRRAVERADELVAELMRQLAESFSRERAALEGQWDRGDEVSTEELRIALQRYRSFFGRLLSL